jgi:hypothetical protein
LRAAFMRASLAASVERAAFVGFRRTELFDDIHDSVLVADTQAFDQLSVPALQPLAPPKDGC